MGHSFGRERRLRRRSDFLRARQQGERVSCPHFVLLVVPQAWGADAGHPAPLPPRLGIVVTRKVGGAVVRNRIKRLCRECFRTWPDLLPRGVDLVVIGRNGAQELGLAQVRDEWARVQAELRRRAEKALAARDNVAAQAHVVARK